MKNLPCVILCGGKSSRMGSNKALLPFGEITLVQFMYEKMQTIFEEVYLVAKHNALFEGFPHRFIQESSGIYAPLIGIETSLQRLKSTFFISVDTPFIQKEMIETMLEARDKEQILYAKTPQKDHFLCGIYQQDIVPIIREMIEEEDFKMSHLIAKTQSAFVEFDDESAFVNLNTPQEYQEAIRRVYG